MNREVILYLSNAATSNNYLEKYIERDPLIIQPDTTPNDVEWDLNYRFQGYQVYQLKDKTVSVLNKTKNFDTVISAVPYYFNESITEIAIENNFNLVT